MTAPVQVTAQAAVEAAAAAAAFQAALLRLGIKAIAEAIKRWAKMPATKAAEQADEWLEDSVRLVMTDRARSRELAVAYYRLARALRTGTTIPDPYDPIPKVVTLGQLRREFALLTESVAETPVSVSQPSDSAPEPVTAITPTEDTPEAPEPSEGDDTEIPIEEIDGFTEDGDEEAEQLEREAEQEARIVLAALGPNSLKRRVAEIDTTRPADEVDQLRDVAHAKAGSRQAAATDRIVKNGARHAVTSLAERDPRAIGYVRVSQTGTPCGFCAMLISRGIFYYSSKQVAEGKTADAPSVRRGEAEEGDQYHDNCNCVAEAVYSSSQYRNSPTYAVNREYTQLWKDVIVEHGLTGKAAETRWRKYFRDMQKKQKKSTRAQAA